MKKFILLLACLYLVASLHSQQVTSLSLVNADTNTDIKVLEQQDTIYLDLTGSNLNIRANVSGAVGSVRFSYNGNPNHQTENVAPYTFAGDNSGDYNAWNPMEGKHSITATAYTEASAGGTASDPVETELVVFQSSESQEPLTLPEDLGTGEMNISGELKKWHKITLSFDGPFHGESDVNPNPFLDYRLEVVFTSGHRKYRVPGYFAADGNAAESSASSGNIWKVHFSPDAEGNWDWKAEFRFGKNIAVSPDTLTGEAAGPIHGQSGSFEVAPSDKTGKDLRAKGRLRYVGAHHLRFEETGEYFLKGGPDAPENLLAYEDFDNTPDNGGRLKTWEPHAGDWQTGDPSWQENKGTELIGAINYLASEGLNTFSFLTMNINGDDKNVFPYLTPGDFRHMDCSKLDQWGIIFDHAAEKGMHLHFKTQETENETLLDGGETDIHRKLYYRELIARFAHHLALNWNLGEENSDQTHAQRKAMAQYFYDTDPYHHPVVIHTYPGAHDEIYTPLLGKSSKLTGASIQTGWNNVHNATKTWVKNSAASGKKWVVANDEQGSAKIGVPDDDYTGSPSIDDIRKQTLWGNIMAGGAGVEYYFGYDLPHSDLTAQDFRSRDLSWDYINYALEFFQNNEIPFWQMQASDKLVSSGWCLADSGNVYLIYLPQGGSTELNIQDDQLYTIKWYDPRNGGELKDGSIASVQGKGLQNTGTPPDNSTSDWLVLLVAQEGVKLAPVARASADFLEITAPSELTFSAAGSYDPDGSIDSYRWDLGDGNTMEGETISYNFTEAGDYLVKLMVTDNDGKTTTDILNVSVSGDPPQSDCDIAPFREIDNIVVVEVESVSPAGGWAKESSVNGYTGDAYYRWNGGNSFNSPGKGLLEYKIYIAHPGTYHFRWHSKIMHGTDATESNDSWLRIPDAYDFFAKKGSSVKYPKGGKFIQSNTTTNGSSSNGWMKVYSSGTTNWTWSCRTSDHDAHEIYATFQEAGVYTVQISGRSNNHAIDRFVLFKDSQYSVSEATSKALDETRCGPDDEWPAHTVNFKITDGDKPVEGARVNFYGMTVTTDSTGIATFNEVLTSVNRSFSVTAECYNSQSGFLDVSSDMQHLIELTALNEPPCNGEPLLYTVIFYISSASYSLPGAEVNFNNMVKTTGSDGSVVFDSIEAKHNMVYTVSFPGYNTYIDSLDLTENKRINIFLNREISNRSSFKSQVKVFPNPASEKLYLEGLEGKNRIYIYSMDGKILRNNYSLKEKTSLDLKSLFPGIYILKILNEGNGGWIYNGLLEVE